MNFSKYQNRQKLRKFRGIDLYAILKPSAKFKQHWFTSIEIIPLLIVSCLMYSHEKTQYEKIFTKNTVYSNIPKFIKIDV